MDSKFLEEQVLVTGMVKKTEILSFTSKLNLIRKNYLSSWIKKTREAFRMKTIKTLTQLSLIHWWQN
jgi:hypothetical protein